MLTRDRQKHSRLRQEFQESQRETIELRAQVAGFRAKLGHMGEMEKSERVKLSEAVARARLAGTPPSAKPLSPEEDPRWFEPPSDPPVWQDESPYVWLTREEMKTMGFSVFEPDGTISPAIRSVLGISAEDSARLMQEIGPVVAAFQQLDVDGARFVTNHPSSFDQHKGQKWTLELPDNLEAGSKMKQEVTEILLRSLGQDKGGMLVALGHRWMDQTFNQFDSGSIRRYSIVRTPDGTVGVTIEIPDQSMSTFGGDDYLQYIPLHLRHLLDPLPKPLEQSE